MMSDRILNEMNLPLASSNEDLETISNNFFKPLFDVTKFEIRSENLRDKGIDFHIEIKITTAKKEVAYTNFRFAIQLKATDTKSLNQDGSISLQLDTGNINYLLNNPMPAYYVLYLKSTNTFYFESINDFVKVINEKDENWNNQASHVLRFNKILDRDGLNEMYQSTLNKGKLQRTINEKIILQSLAVNSSDKLLIGANFNIYNDTEIRKLVEVLGLELINDGKWKEIISVHKKASGNVASSALYNLVLGVANYYNGNLVEALSFLKTAFRFKVELSEYLKNYLHFFDITVRYSIGLLSMNDYIEKMAELESTENIGLYVKLESAKRDYIESITTSDNSYEKYKEEIDNIINDPNSNENITLNAKCEMILFEGVKNNMEYLEGISMINAIEAITGPDLELRKDAAFKFIEANKNWFINTQSLKEEANRAQNKFPYFILITNEVKVTFEFNVFTDLVYIVQEIEEAKRPDKPDKKPMFDKLINNIILAYNYCNCLGTPFI